jgi:hypothetical protein
MTKDLSDLIEEALSPSSCRPPWERLKVGRKYLESLKAFEAFVIYRDMGASRSLIRVQTEYNKSASIFKWSSQFRWVDRCAEYDDHMDRQALVEQEEERKKLAREHLVLAKLLQQKAFDRLKNIDPAKISPAQIPNYLQTAVTIGRLAIGEPTEKVDHAGTGRIIIVDDIPRKTEEKKRK